jgi:hypothetical protein
MKQSVREATVFSLVLIAVAPVIAGCGGGSGSAAQNSAATTATTARPQSRSPFIVRADAICGRVNAEIVSVKASSQSAREITRVASRHLSLERQGLGELEKLAPPSALASGWRRILSYRRTLADELTKFVNDTRRNDQSAVKTLIASKKRVHVSLRKSAAANGLATARALDSEHRRPTLSWPAHPVQRSRCWRANGTLQYRCHGRRASAARP